MGFKWLVGKEKEYYNDTQNIVELEYCPRGGKNCSGLRNELNSYLVEARRHRENKEFTKAITHLKESFDITFQLQKTQCDPCTAFFRLHIYHLLEKIISELNSLTTGFFKKLIYTHDLKIAESTLLEMKQKMDENPVKLKENITEPNPTEKSE
jgi:hypothetical protein